MPLLTLSNAFIVHHWVEALVVKTSVELALHGQLQLVGLRHLALGHDLIEFLFCPNDVLLLFWLLSWSRVSNDWPVLPLK